MVTSGPFHRASGRFAGVRLGEGHRDDDRVYAAGVAARSGGDMQRGGGGIGEGTGDLGPEVPPSAARGRHRRRRRQQPRAEQPVADGGRAARMDVTYKYFGAPNGATAARVPTSMRPEELGGDELGQGMFTSIKPETMAAMVLTGIEGVPLHRVPPLELVVLHPDYAVVKLPTTVVDPLRGIGEETVGAAAFIWSTVPDRSGPRDAFGVYRLLHEWQDFSRRLHEAGHQPYCLVWP